MSFNKGLIYGFDLHDNLLAIIDDNDVLRIWETPSNTLKKEYSSNLKSTCTALVWLSERTKSKKKTKSDPSLIAIGSSKGKIALYSHAHGKFVRHFHGEGHNGKVTSMAYDADTENLFSCGLDCQLLVWSLKSNQAQYSFNVGPEIPQRIVYYANSKSLAIGSRQIKVYRSDGQLIETFTGHFSQINCMSSFVTNDEDEYILSTSVMECDVRIWKKSGKGRNKIAVCTLLMDDATSCLTCEVQENGTVRVAGVTSRGLLKIFILDIASTKTTKVFPADSTFSIVTDNLPPNPVAIILAKYTVNDENILIGYGDKHCLKFERLTRDRLRKRDKMVRNDPCKSYGLKRKSDGSQKEAVLKIATPTVDNGQVQYKSGLTMPKKRIQSDVPMEARLLNLDISNGQVQPQSKAHLLEQALTSNDAEILHSVLCIKDEKIIRLTLERLSVPFVIRLVNELSHLMQLKRSDVESAIRWLKILPQVHSSQLMALGGDGLRESFEASLNVINQRVNCLYDLSSLSGRLNSLVNRIRKQTVKENLKDERTLIIKDDGEDMDYNSEDEESLHDNIVTNGDGEDPVVAPAAEIDDLDLGIIYI